MKRLAFISLFLLGCTKDLPNKEQLIDELYTRQKVEYLQSKDTECKNEIMALVELKLDSIIDKYIRTNLLDSVGFPSRPDKPAKPNNIINKVVKFQIDSLTHSY